MTSVVCVCLSFSVSVKCRDPIDSLYDGFLLTIFTKLPTSAKSMKLENM